MKYYFKKYKILILIVIILYLPLLFCLLYPTKYSVTAPGELRSTAKVYQSDEFTINDQFYTIYVLGYYPLTPFQSFLAKRNHEMEVGIHHAEYRDTTKLNEFKKGQLSKEASLIESAIAAYEEAGKIDTSIQIEYEFRGLKIYHAPSRLKDLEVGSEIIGVNGNSYLDYLNNPSGFLDLVKLDDNNSIELTLKNGKKFTYVKQGSEYLAFVYHFKIIYSSPKLVLSGLNDLVGGPSGGLIQGLSLYASLLKINTEKIKIAGTGTLSYAGFVGEIGGLRQKIYTANRSDIDYFFVPKSQYNLISDISTNYLVFQVECFSEAVDKLYEALKE
ncbi:MAG: S16 family serine protease [Acholeplasmataceae bacterium]